jgi:dTDP-4-amino-4,6-dideoxygalactose transaminase
MVLSNDRAVLDRVRMLREYDERPTLRAAAFNHKMTELQAAVGLTQLDRLSSFIERRRAIAARYDTALRQCGVEVPEPPKGRTHVYYRYVVRLDTPRMSPPLEVVLTALERRGIACRRPVFRALHTYLGLEQFPQSERAMATALSVPLYPSLTDDEAGRVIQAVAEVLHSGAARR